MRDFLLVCSLLLEVYWFLLLARIVVEMIANFSRAWSPRGVLAVVLEWLFVLTDPPVKLLRRLIPPARIGGVALDLSILVLFLLIWVLQVVLAQVITRV